MSIKTVIGAVRNSGQQVALANVIQLACTLLCVTQRHLTWDPERQTLHIDGVRAGRAFSLHIQMDDLCKCANRGGKPASPAGTGPPAAPP